jgi:hypothetical protein
MDPFSVIAGKIQTVLEKHSPILRIPHGPGSLGWRVVPGKR